MHFSYWSTFLDLLTQIKIKAHAIIVTYVPKCIIYEIVNTFHIFEQQGQSCRKMTSRTHILLPLWILRSKGGIHDLRMNHLMILSIRHYLEMWEMMIPTPFSIFSHILHHMQFTHAIPVPTTIIVLRNVLCYQHLESLGYTTQ